MQVSNKSGLTEGLKDHLQSLRNCGEDTADILAQAASLQSVGNRGDGSCEREGSRANGDEEGKSAETHCQRKDCGWKENVKVESRSRDRRQVDASRWSRIAKASYSLYYLARRHALRKKFSLSEMKPNAVDLTQRFESLQT